VGIQILLPGLSKCPAELMAQPPWFTGGAGGGGLCPAGYWNLAAIGPGALVLAAAVAGGVWIRANRLVFYEDTGGGMGVGLSEVEKCEGADKGVVDLKGDLKGGGGRIRFEDVES
jgi:hypothetical protein